MYSERRSDRAAAAMSDVGRIRSLKGDQRTEALDQVASRMDAERKRAGWERRPCACAVSDRKHVCHADMLTPQSLELRIARKRVRDPRAGSHIHMAELVSCVKLIGVFADGDRLVPGEVPFVLAAACSLCRAPSLETPCEFCGLPFCQSCLPCPSLSHVCARRMPRVPHATA